MGLYGSPDLSNKHDNEDEVKGFKRNKKPLKPIIRLIIILFILVTLLIGKDTIDEVNNAVNSNSIPPTDANNFTNVIEIGSRQNPAKIGDIQQGTITDARGLDCEIEIELLEVKKKEEAIEMASDIYTYVELGDNQEHLFAKFRVKNTKNNSSLDLPFNFNWTDFDYATSDYKKYSYTMGLAAGGELLEAVDLYEGAEHEGWICLYVERDDPSPKAVFLDKLWFDL